jgi:hypothetical protein
MAPQPTLARWVGARVLCTLDVMRGRVSWNRKDGVKRELEKGGDPARIPKKGANSKKGCGAAVVPAHIRGATMVTSDNHDFHAQQHDE